MALLMGIDTGGTYTDAVLLDDLQDELITQTKALTTRPDLAIGIGNAIDNIITQSQVDPAKIALVSLSTTLATNALVEGQGGRVALIFIGFSARDLERADVQEALGNDPAIIISGGHSHTGAEAAPLDHEKLCAELKSLPSDISGIAIAARFATRNPQHEQKARQIVRDHLTIPVTCSYELSQALGGPKRALTAILNARLIGLIDKLITATKTHLVARNIEAKLMVVRGDGALISAELAQERPIETILSGPAASIAGAQWLTGEDHALVSDIGGTTTDICLLRNGAPHIDPRGAKVGKFRTMVEAVAMRTFGLGGDSEVHLIDGLQPKLFLGPKRVLPVSLFSLNHHDLVHNALDRALTSEVPSGEATRFLMALVSTIPEGLDPRENTVLARLMSGPLRWADAVQTRVEEPAAARLIQRGLIVVSDITPSDASHVVGSLQAWDSLAAEKALKIYAKRRIGSGDRLALNSQSMAQMIVDQLTLQTGHCLLETAFAEEGWDQPDQLAAHPLVTAGLAGHQDIIGLKVGVAMPVIGLGASAHVYYDSVRARLNCPMIIPAHADVANAVGAVVGQVAIHMEGNVTTAGEGSYRVHLPGGPVQLADQKAALDCLRKHLTKIAIAQAHDSGVEEIRIHEELDLRQAEVESQVMFIEARLRITARGRPRITR